MNPAIETQSAGALKPELKYVRVLRRLLTGPLHRFEAERYPVSDHVLNSTVSELKKRGVSISSSLIHLPGYSRAGCYVALYTLEESSRLRALQLIGAGQ
ncbi:MAG TPA: hypothetical protein VGN07_23760 [Steroidobacteraceae bacterium]